MYEKGVDTSPGDQTLVGNLGDAYRWEGDKEKARTTYEKAIALAYKELQVNPRGAGTLGQLALYYAKKGDPGQAKNFVKRSRGIDKSNVDLIYNAAVIDTIAGQPAEAMKELRVALQKGYSAEALATDPEFGSLQSRPDFQALVKQFSVKK